MKKNISHKLFLLVPVSCVVIAQCCVCFAGAVPFADNGALKMLYDNRMYPQAVELDGSVYIVWRGEKGYPYITACDLKSRTFSKPFMLLTGMEDQINAAKYKKDHHYSPVIWADSKGYLHVLFGCHGSAGLHLISARPQDMTQWRRCSAVSDSLSYPKVHLASGKAFNYEGTELTTPVRKMTADRQCLVWDTRERVAAVGPSIFLDDNDQPFFLLPVSDETPYKCRFYLVKRRNGLWVKTPITRTSHPFNACHLAGGDDGLLRAYLVTGEGENISDENMDRYGWGDRVGLWVSDRKGDNWKLGKDLTPLKGYKYQNIQFVSQSAGQIVEDIILFYGWRDTDGDGTAFLWDDRN